MRIYSDLDWKHWFLEGFCTKVFEVKLIGKILNFKFYIYNNEHFLLC